jgi:hypothetical protein
VDHKLDGMARDGGGARLGYFAELRAMLTVMICRFRVPLEEIAYVRMILEGYEGLAVMTSDAGVGVIEWWIAPGREEEAEALARVLERDAGMRPV